MGSNVKLARLTNFAVEKIACARHRTRFTVAFLQEIRRKETTDSWGEAGQIERWWR